jgi:hypothetical protein
MEQRQYRIDHGLCPECGRESAPYYLCEEHRQLNSLTRMLNRMADRGVLQKEKQGGKSYYSPGVNSARCGDFSWRQTLFDMDPDDKRLRPRMGRRPIDLDETLISIFETAGRRLTMEEILSAWGKLRSKRKTESLVGDMSAIILAQHRRDERNAKRLARMRV